jgi:hypothetical protein
VTYGRHGEPAPQTAAVPTKSVEQPSAREPEPSPPVADDDTEAGTGVPETTGSTPAPTPDPPPRSGATKTKTKPKPTNERASTPRATVVCSDGLKEQINDRLGSAGGGIYKLEVRAAANGTLVLQGCKGCEAERTDRANEALAGKKLRPATEEDLLPCRTTIQWK